MKQIFTVLCAVWFFHLNVSPLNVLGIMLTLLGGGWYTMIEYRAKHGSIYGREFGVLALLKPPFSGQISRP